MGLGLEKVGLGAPVSSAPQEIPLFRKSRIAWEPMAYVGISQQKKRRPRLFLRGEVGY